MQEPMITNAKSSGIDLDRRSLKRLMRRTDAHGLASFFGWLAMLLALGYGLHLSLGTWWVVPAMTSRAPFSVPAPIPSAMNARTGRRSARAG